ncbi:hypothetical protein ACLMJK_009029 [Lecanora helva]
MESVDLVPLLEQLDDDIDDIEEALSPLLQNTLSATAGKLPLLDKANLYVIVTYALESILFSYLRLNGIPAKEHPVFRELSRVKQYFEKLRKVEKPGTAPTTKLDKAAAGRFIKHALAGNQKLEATSAQEQLPRNAAAHIRFEEISEETNDRRDQSSGLQIQVADAQSQTEIADAAFPNESGIPKLGLNLDTSTSDSKSKKNHKKRRGSNDVEAATNSKGSEELSNQDRKKLKKSKQKL